MLTSVLAKRTPLLFDKMTQQVFNCEQEQEQFLINNSSEVLKISQVSLQDDKNKQSSPWNITNLQKFTNMTCLYFYCIKQVDLSPLLNMPQIVDLYFQNCTFDANAQLQFTIHAQNLYLNYKTTNLHVLKKRRYRAAENYDETKLNDLFKVFNNFFEFSFFNNQLSNLQALAQLKQLRKLEIENCLINDFSGLKDLKLLEELCLNQLTINDLNMLQFCAQIKSLTVQECDQIRDWSGMQKYVQLDELCITNCGGITVSFTKQGNYNCIENHTEQQLEQLFNIYNKIEYLFVNQCPIIDLRGLHRLQIYLKQLKIENCNISDFCQLQNLKLLEELCLKQLDIRNMNMLQFCQQIKSLTVYKCDQIIDWSGMQKYTQLDRLELNQLNIIDVNMLEFYEQIKILIIQKCDLISDWSGMLKCTQLDELELNQLNIKDVNILQFCTQVNQLSIVDCNQIQQYQSLKFCRNTNVEIQKCNNFSVKFRAVKLQYASIQDLDYVQDIKQVLTVAHNFTQLSLFQINTDNLDFLSELKSLRELEINDCNTLTNYNGLKTVTLTELHLVKMDISNMDILQYCAQINQLTISSCSLIQTYQSLQLCKNTKVEIKNCNNVNAKFRVIKLQYMSIQEFGYAKDINQFISITNKFTQLSLFKINIDNLNFLSELKSLRELEINDCNTLTNYGGLKGIPLTELQMVKMNTQDMDILQFCDQVKSLLVQRFNRIQNVGDLKYCVELKQLVIKNTCLTSRDGYIQMIQPDELEIDGLIDQQIFDQLMNCKMFEQIKISNSIVDNFDEMENQVKVKQLHATDCYKIRSVEGLKYCVELKQLDVQNTNILKEGGYIQVKQPDVLKIWGLLDQQIFDQLMNCKAFEQIRIDNSSIIDFNNMKNQSKLQQLHVTDCYNIHDVGGLKYCTQLEQLTIKNTSLTQKDGYIQVKNNVMELDQILHQTYFDQLNQCQQFDQLIVSNSNIFTCDQMENQTQLKQLKISNCGKLKSLDGLANCSNVENIDIDQTKIQNLDGFINMKQLTNISISSCFSLTNIDSLVNCSKLKEIQLKSISISNIDVFNNFKQLEQVSLVDCQQLCDISGLNDCIQVQKLNIQNCEITNIDSLIDKKELYHIIIKSCMHVTNLDPLQQCHKLQHIEIENTWIGDITSISNLENVQYLKITDNENLQDVSIELKNKEQILQYFEQWKNTERQQLNGEQPEQQSLSVNIRTQNPNKFKNSDQLKIEELEKKLKEYEERMDNVMENFKEI